MEAHRSAVDRKIKVDMEAGYQLAEFEEYSRSLSYQTNISQPRTTITPRRSPH